jgi:hypothetical protein
MKLAEGRIKLPEVRARWLVESMGKTKLIAFGIILILLSASTLLFIRTSQSVGSKTYTLVEKAVCFLLNSQFNQSLGLCREAPNVAPNTYWPVSDNLWAWKALGMANEYGLLNAAESEATAEKIKTELAELAANYSLPTDSNGLPRSYAHEAIIGDILRRLITRAQTTHCTKMITS